MRRHHIGNTKKIYEFYSITESPITVGVSDGNGFNINGQINIHSSLNSLYHDFDIVSYPNWVLSISKGDIYDCNRILNMTVSRNRDSDSIKTGTIELLQRDSDLVINIQINQLGRLTDGIPTEYPYVSSENVFDEQGKRVVQIGEQIWSSELMSHLFNDGNLKGSRIDEYRAGPNNWQNIGSQRINNWGSLYNGQTSGYPQLFNGILPTADEFHENGGLRYNAATLSYFKSTVYSTYGETSEADRDFHKHHIFTRDDLLEMAAASVSAKWDGNADPWSSSYDFSNLTLVKKSLNTSINGYDDVRYTYPARWQWDTNTNVPNGEDTYGFGTLLYGRFQPYVFGNDQNNLAAMFRESNTLQLEQPSDFGYVNQWNWRDKNMVYTQGLYLEQNNFFGAFGHPLRTVRYRELDYDIYDNGAEIIKVNNGDSIPAGYTRVPIGPLRGAWFGNQSLSRTQLSNVAAFVNDRLLNGNSNGGVG